MTIVPYTRSSILRSIEEFLESEAYTGMDVNVKSMARMLGTNRVYLAEVLRDEYGQTIKDFISYHRIEHAKDLARRSDSPLRVKELAAMSGFQSLATFYRNFLKLEGCPPSDWLDECYRSRGAGSER